MEGIFGIFIVLMLALFGYSFVRTYLEIREKTQPSIDSIFDALHSLVFRKRPVSKGERPQITK